MINKIKTILNKIFRRDSIKYYFVSLFAFDNDMTSKSYFDLTYKSIGLLNRKNLTEDFIIVFNKTYKINSLQKINISYYKELTKEEYEEFIR